MKKLVSHFVLAFAALVTAPLFAASGTPAASFIQSGTGAGARATLEKAREVFTVKDFKAKGDCSTDDTAAFNAALTARGALGGGRVHVPAPAVCYVISGQITVPSNVRLSGEKSQLRMGAGGRILLSCSDCALSDLRIYQTIAATHPYQVRTSGAGSNITVERVDWTIATPGTAYAFVVDSDVSNVTFRDNTCAGYGYCFLVTANNGTAVQSQGFLLTGNYLTGCGECITFNNQNNHALFARGVVVTKNPVIQATLAPIGFGVDFVEVRGGVITDNGIFVDLAGTQGVHLEGPGRDVVVGKNAIRITSSTGSGVVVGVGYTDVLVNDNAVSAASSTTGVGVSFPDGGTGHNLTVSALNNRITGAFAACMNAASVQPSTTGLSQIVANNVFRSCAIGVQTAYSNVGDIRDNLFDSVPTVYYAFRSARFGRTVLQGTAPTAIVTNSQGVSTVRVISAPFSYTHTGGGGEVCANVLPAPLRHYGAVFMAMELNGSNTALFSGTWQYDGSATSYPGGYVQRSAGVLSGANLQLSGGYVKACSTMSGGSNTLVGTLEVADYVR